MRCIDVAALFAAVLFRRNPGSLIVPFSDHIHDINIRANADLLDMTNRLTMSEPGGTDCFLPLREANEKHPNHRFSGCILISDNESWLGNTNKNETTTLTEWNRFVENQKRLSGQNAAPKLVCLDLQPNEATQATERVDIMNIGGFSHAISLIIARFFANESPSRLVEDIENVLLY